MVHVSGGRSSHVRERLMGGARSRLIRVQPRPLNRGYIVCSSRHNVPSARPPPNCHSKIKSSLAICIVIQEFLFVCDLLYIVSVSSSTWQQRLSFFPGRNMDQLLQPISGTPQYIQHPVSREAGPGWTEGHFLSEDGSAHPSSHTHFPRIWWRRQVLELSASSVDMHVPGLDHKAGVSGVDFPEGKQCQDDRGSDIALTEGLSIGRTANGE